MARILGNTPSFINDIDKNVRKITFDQVPTFVDIHIAENEGYCIKPKFNQSPCCQQCKYCGEYSSSKYLSIRCIKCKIAKLKYLKYIKSTSIENSKKYLAYHNQQNKNIPNLELVDNKFRTVEEAAAFGHDIDPDNYRLKRICQYCQYLENGVRYLNYKPSYIIHKRCIICEAGLIKHQILIDMEELEDICRKLNRLREKYN